MTKIGIFRCAQNEKECPMTSCFLSFVTCSFSYKGDGKIWYLGNGFFENVDDLAIKISRETGLPCVKGTAHLPEEYTVEVFKE